MINGVGVIAQSWTDEVIEWLNFDKDLGGGYLISFCIQFMVINVG